MTPTSWLIDGAGEKGCVELWANERLPFEPKGALKNMREELRAALAPLSAREGEVLRAVYASRDRRFCDPENVLLYNVGESYLASGAAQGLRFERIYEVPLATRNLGFAALHHHRYELVSRDAGFSGWTRAEPLVRWERVASPPLRGDQKPQSAWHALKCAGVESRTRSHSGPFGLTVVIHAPSSEPEPRPAALVKPLFDGVISALHGYDRPTDALSEVARRLSGPLMTDPHTLRAWLRDKRSTVLRPRTVVGPYRNGVKWNPADDLCVAGELLIDRGPATADWSFSGEAFAVSLYGGRGRLTL